MENREILKICIRNLFFSIKQLLLLLTTRISTINRLVATEVLLRRKWKKVQRLIRPNLCYRDFVPKDENFRKRKIKKFNQLNNGNVNLSKTLGVHYSAFHKLHRLVNDELAEDGRFLNPKTQLLMTFDYLRNASNFRDLANTYIVSKSTVSRILSRTIPLCNSALNGVISIKNIQPNMSYIIDCTCHRIRRVHPNQHEFYRGDVGYHFITSQIILSADKKKIISFITGKGHNNDPGMSQISLVNEFVRENKLTVFGDQAYSKTLYLTPLSPEVLAHYKDGASVHGHIRMEVEHFIGILKRLKFCDLRSNFTPEKHAFTLELCAKITQVVIDARPDVLKLKDNSVSQETLEELLLFSKKE